MDKKFLSKRCGDLQTTSKREREISYRETYIENSVKRMHGAFATGLRSEKIYRKRARIL